VQRHSRIDVSLAGTSVTRLWSIQASDRRFVALINVRFERVLTLRLTNVLDAIETANESCSFHHIRTQPINICSLTKIMDRDDEGKFVKKTTVDAVLEILETENEPLTATEIADRLNASNRTIIGKLNN
jgi:hypothetical protein